MLNLIKKATEAGVFLYVEDAQLKYKLSSDVFPEELKNLIVENKQELINFLNTEVNDSDVIKPSLVGVKLPENTELLTSTFDRIATKYSDKTALVFGEQKVSFAELKSQINGLASYLIKHCESNSPIALVLDRSVDVVVSIMAILKTGMAYLPIDPANPDERVMDFLLDAGVETVICHQAHTERLAQFKGNIVQYDEAFQNTIAQHSAFYDGEHVDAAHVNDNAYVIYTSGSTGKPKGVVCKKKNLSHFYQVMVQQFDELTINETSGWIWNASYAFDASLKALVALARGQTIVIPDEQQIKDPKALAGLIQAYNVDVFNAPPLLMDYVLPILEELNVKTHLIVSGDRVYKQLWQRLASYAEKNAVKVLNAYGPTETTVNATYAVLNGVNAITIGKPVVNTELYVLDSELNPVDIGSEGELYIGGSGLAEGYLNRPDATDESFVYLNNGNTRVFKSGDIVQLLDNGELIFCGRGDGQIKYRGFRIELDDIKANLCALDMIENAVVNTEGEGIEKRIVSYVVAANDSCSAEGIQEGLATILPEYMLPSRYYFVPEIPLTSGGKVDFARLRAQSNQKSATKQTKSSDVYSVMADIWCDVLGISEVSPEANFFQLGGHSLLAMMLLRRIGETFGCTMEIKELLLHLTLQSQVDWVNSNIPQDFAIGASGVETSEVNESQTVESRLRDLWRELLGVEEINAEDNFFKLGGHSLLAMKLLADISKEFNVVIQIRELYSCITFSRQVDYIKEKSPVQELSHQEVEEEMEELTL